MRRNRACESDPAWDHLLALLYHVDDAPPVLPTHRVLLSGPSGEALLLAVAELFEVERLADAAAVLARMASPTPVAPDATGSGRVGLVSDGLAAILTARDAAFAPLLDPSNEAFDSVWKLFGEGLLYTLQAAALAMVLSLVLGTLIAVARLQLGRTARIPLVAVVEVLEHDALDTRVFVGA